MVVGVAMKIERDWTDIHIFSFVTKLENMNDMLSVVFMVLQV